MSSNARLTRSQAFRGVGDAIQRELESPLARFESEALESESRAVPLSARANAEVDRVVRAVEGALRPDGGIGSACEREERRLAEVRARIHREGIRPARARVDEGLQQLAGVLRVVHAATEAVGKFRVDTERDVARLGAAESMMAQAVEAVQAESNALCVELDAVRSLVRSLRDLATSFGSGV